MIAMGLAAVIFSCVVAYFLFESHLARQQEQMQLIGSKTVSTVDHEMNMRAFSVKAMRRTAENYLSGRTRLMLDPTRYLRRYENHNGYTLDLPPGFSSEEIGNITGAGKIPAGNSTTAREMAMTIGLLPLFQTLTSRDNDTPWVYYTSQNHFTHIYPRASPEEFFFTDKSLEYDVFTMALPKNNPQRKVFWTPPYLDEAGKGMMVTVASPVYEGDHFRGSVAIDITLSKLSVLLHHYATPNYRIYLYTRNGDFLAGPATAHDFKTGKLTSAVIQARKDMLISDLDLSAVPWRILVVTSRADVYKNAFWYALPFALVVVLLFGSVMLLIALVLILRKTQECSIRDGLTGIYNRRHFDTIAGRELASAHRDQQYFGLIMLDIDHFKLYNDTYGHQAGDQILKSISNILTNTLKRPVDYCFRIGGEEFAILTKAERPEQIEKFAQILLTAIEKSQIDFPVSPFKFITVSLGCAALSPEIQLNMEVLYSTCDQALYSAKNEGRNRVISIRI